MKSIRRFDNKGASFLTCHSNTPKLQYSITPTTKMGPNILFWRQADFLSTFSGFYFLGNIKTNGMPTNPMAALIK